MLQFQNKLVYRCVCVQINGIIAVLYTFSSALMIILTFRTQTGESCDRKVLMSMESHLPTYTQFIHCSIFLPAGEQR